MDRGRLIRRMLRFTGLIPNNSRLLYPVWRAAQLTELREERHFERLPARFDGFQIAYASDIHFGPLLDLKRLTAMARRLQSMDADLILLGGDFGEDTASAIECVERLPLLRADCGIFSAIGNHDHMGSEQEFTRLLAAMLEKGITPLVNQAHTLRRGDQSLCLCSVDDIKEGRPDFEPIKKAAGAADFLVFAPHSPDLFPPALKVRRLPVDLGLAGHTHGGQVVVGGRSLHSSSRYGDRFRSGWYDMEGGQLMVSNGVGCSLLPIRIGAPAQIHLLTLRRGAKPAAAQDQR